jgi:hypothetical protein
MKKIVRRLSYHIKLVDYLEVEKMSDPSKNGKSEELLITAEEEETTTDNPDQIFWNEETEEWDVLDVKEAPQHSLLVWHLVPEQVKMYLIPNSVASKYREFLDQAHSKLINAHDMNDGLRFLNAAISEEKGFETDGFEKYEGIFVKYERNISQDPIVGVVITSVYSSGFIL